VRPDLDRTFRRNKFALQQKPPASGAEGYFLRGS